MEKNLDVIHDAIGDVITGIPAPLRKNFFKACAQLCTATIDIPVSWLEGKSAENRAAYEARVQIIKKQGESIANGIDVPIVYIAKASEKFASKIIKEQLNLDDIAFIAARELYEKTINENNVESSEISDDWLNEFENHARLKTSDEMKLVFGKLLSGEIHNPGTFSIKTIRLVSQFDNKLANLFQRLCSHAISMRVGSLIVDARVVTFNGSAASNSLMKFGLSFSELNILQEHGLIISDYNSYMPFSSCIVNENYLGAFLVFGNNNYGLFPIQKEQHDKELKLHGVSLTTSAKELLKIVPVIAVTDYKTELETFFNNKGLVMKEL